MQKLIVSRHAPWNVPCGCFRPNEPRSTESSRTDAEGGEEGEETTDDGDPFEVLGDVRRTGEKLTAGVAERF